MRHKAKVLMVVATFCLVTQGSQQEDECRGTKLEIDASMYLCQKIGVCRRFHPLLIWDKTCLSQLLLEGGMIWARWNPQTSFQYWIPRKMWLYYKRRLESLPTQEEKYKYKQRIRQKIDDILDRDIGLGLQFYRCTDAPTKPTTPRRATTWTTGVTTASKTPDRTTTVNDDSWDGTTLEILIKLIIVMGVFASATLLAIFFFRCFSRKNNNREDTSESSSTKSGQDDEDHEDHEDHEVGSRRTTIKSSKKSLKSQRSVASKESNRTSKKSSKSRRISLDLEESSSSAMAEESQKSKIRTRFDTLDLSAPTSEMSRQTKATVDDDLMKAAQTQKSIKDNILKGGNVKKENITKKKTAKSKYDKV